MADPRSLAQLLMQNQTAPDYSMTMQRSGLSGILSQAQPSLESALQGILGIQNAEAADAIKTPPKGSPAYYYTKGSTIYDSANVPVTLDSLKAHVSRIDSALKNNEKMMQFAPSAAKLANDDLSQQRAFIVDFINKNGGSK